MKDKLLKPHNLEIEFTYPVKCNNYQEAMDKCPKGFKLAEIWELIKIYLHYDYSSSERSILKEFKDGKFLTFYTQELPWDTENKFSFEGKSYWFLRKEDGEFGVHLSSITAYNNDHNYDGGHVIYIKDLKDDFWEIKKTKTKAKKKRAKTTSRRIRR